MTGDFDIDVQGNESPLKFMKRELRLEYVPTKGRKQMIPEFTAPYKWPRNKMLKVQTRNKIVTEKIFPQYVPHIKVEKNGPLRDYFYLAHVPFILGPFFLPCA